MPLFRSRNVLPLSVLVRWAREAADVEGEAKSTARLAASMLQCRFSGLPQSTAATMAWVKPKAAALLVSSDASAVSASWSDADAVGRLDAEAVGRGWFVVASWFDAEAVDPAEGCSATHLARPGAGSPSARTGTASPPVVTPEVLANTLR